MSNPDGTDDIKTWGALFARLICSPFAWFRWAGRTFSKIIFTLANGRVIGAPEPKQLIPDELPNGLFGGAKPYEVYKDTRQRIWEHVKHRGERQWTITTWVAGILTTIIAGTMVMAMDGKEIKPALQWALTVWIVFMAVFALVRILHDHVVAGFHVRACQKMDEVFSLHLEDSDHKIDMKLHHFLMQTIFLLAVGALILVWFYNSFKSAKEPEAKIPCCCQIESRTDKLPADSSQGELSNHVDSPSDRNPKSRPAEPPKNCNQEKANATSAARDSEDAIGKEP